jgi:hypothetical protein
MPSYRENLKPEELASLLALALRHRVQLPKPPVLLGLVRQEASHAP